MMPFRLIARSLPLVVAGMLSASLASATPLPDPPVRLRLNEEGRYWPGDGIRAEIRSREDGYLLVIHAEPSGRIRVVFPVDPGNDAFIKGNKTYELRSRSGQRDIAIADEGDGPGALFAAVASTPWHFDSVQVNGHWDYRALPAKVAGDAETELRELAEKLAGGAVRYDLATYVVAGRGMAGRQAYVAPVAVGFGPWFGVCGWRSCLWDPFWGAYYGYPYGGYAWGGYGWGGYGWGGGRFGGIYGGGVIIGGGRGGQSNGQRLGGGRSWGGRRR